MHQITENYTAKWQSAFDHFLGELSSLRSNRVHPSMIEKVKVEYYGTATPLGQIGTITAPEPRLLVVEPWDKQALKDIERAFQDNETGFSVQSDGSVIRLTLPMMTEETRKQTVVLLNRKAEDARVSIRKIREDALKEAKRKKEAGEIPEDEFFSIQKEIQDYIDSLNTDIKTTVESKEKEIMTI